MAMSSLRTYSTLPPAPPPPPFSEVLIWLPALPLESSGQICRQLETPLLDSPTPVKLAPAVQSRCIYKKCMEVASSSEFEEEEQTGFLASSRLSGGVAVIQVGAQTETELKEKKLRVEDALNATKVSCPARSRQIYP